MTSALETYWVKKIGWLGPKNKKMISLLIVIKVSLLDGMSLESGDLKGQRSFQQQSLLMASIFVVTAASVQVSGGSSTDLNFEVSSVSRVSVLQKSRGGSCYDSLLSLCLV